MYGKHENKLALARQAGIEAKQIAGNPSDLKRLKDTFALVVEATGSRTGLVLAQQMAEPRGTLVLKSTFQGAAPVETWPIVVKELTVLDPAAAPSPRRSHYSLPAKLIRRHSSPARSRWPRRRRPSVLPSNRVY
jgi:threonine dehydrogenase-like Zn-dependent dehydrogenase